MKSSFLQSLLGRVLLQWFAPSFVPLCSWFGGGRRIAGRHLSSHSANQARLSSEILFHKAQQLKSLMVHQSLYPHPQRRKVWQSSQPPSHPPEPGTSCAETHHTTGWQIARG